MKMKKLLAICFAALLVLTAAFTAGTVQANATEVETSNSAISFEELDVQALVSNKLSGVEVDSVTLNPDERYEAIVTLEGTTLIEYANDAGMSLNDYMLSEEGIEMMQVIAQKQKSAMSAIQALGLNIKFKYNYTTLMNGFGVEIRYGDIAAVKKLAVVENVTLAEVYDSPEVSASEDIMNVITAREEYGYTGEGMVIGIIDTGIDNTHEAFSVMPGNVKITQEYVAERLDSLYAMTGFVLNYGGTVYDQKYYGETLTADDVYVNAKIPFSFDYADVDTDARSLGEQHGTHVAGIAAGNCATFTGIAPDAQLLALKVFSDASSGASSLDVVAALNDAYILGADAVNLSLGSASGFAIVSDVREPWFDLLRDSGAEICISAGNEGSAGTGSPLSPEGYPLVLNPEYGMIGAPGVVPQAFTVASIDSEHVTSAYLMVNETKLEWNEISTRFFYTEMYERYNLADTQDVEYVMIPNIGAPEDYTGLDLTNKIAVVQRGEISFQEKIENAGDAGAIACFIYDNVEGDYINMSIEGDTIPAAFIYKADGEMLAAQENKKVTFSKEYFSFFPLVMSDFSSWGGLGTLELKPEITAPGGDVLSAYDVFEGESRWAYMSGTSMAAPNMAGASVLIRQFVNEQFPDLSAKEKGIMVYKIAMSTATLWADNDGNIYSPRKQGAGVVDVTAAVTTDAYINVPGQEKTKIELGDDPDLTGEYVLDFEIVNFGDEANTYTVNPIVLIDRIVSAFYSLTSMDVSELCTFEITAEGDGSFATETGNITVNANGKMAVKLTIAINETIAGYLTANADYNGGGYIDGFVQVINTKEGGHSLSVPFMGFYGDFTRAANFDFTIYEENAPLNSTFNSLLWGYAPVAGDDWAIGTYAFKTPEDVEVPIFDDHLAISPVGNGIQDIAYSYMGILRNLAYITYEISDAITGEVYYTETYTALRKSYYDVNNELIMPDIQDFNFTSEGARNFYAALPSNTQLLVSISGISEFEFYATDIDPEREGTCWRPEVTFNVVIDNQAPVLVGDELNVWEEEGRVYMSADIYDNHYLMAAWPTSIHKNDAGSYVLGEDLCEFPTPAFEETTGQTSIMVWDITDYLDLIEEGVIGITAFDYALNQTTYVLTGITIPELPDPDTIVMSTDAMELGIGQTDSIYYTILPLGYGYDKVYTIEWESADPSVATVSDLGEVEAVGAGETTISVNVMFADEAGIVTRLKGVVDVTVLPQATEIFVEDVIMPIDGAALLEFGVPEGTYTEFISAEYTLVEESPEGIVKFYSDTDLTAIVYGLATGEVNMIAEACYYDSLGEIVTLTKSFKVVVTEEIFSGVHAPNGLFLYDAEGNELEDLMVAVGETLEFQVLATPDFADATIKIYDILSLGAGYTFTQTSITGVSVGMSLAVIESIHNPDVFIVVIINIFDPSSTEPEDPDPVDPEPDPVVEFVIEDGVLVSYNGEGGDVVIPDNVVAINDGVFYGMTEITSITMPDTIKSIGIEAFNGVEITVGADFLPASLEYLGNDALKTITFDTEELALPENLTYIGDNNFFNCEFTSIVFNSKLVHIGDYAFYASEPETIVLPESLEHIGVGAFMGAITEFEDNFIPSNIKFIGSRAFYNCDFSFENLVLPEGVEHVGAFAFRRANFETITIPASLVEVDFGTYTMVGENPEKYIIAEDHPVYSIQNDAIVDNHGNYLLYQGIEDLNSVIITIPDNIVRVAPWAFYDKSLAMVIVPESVKSIGEAAFYGYIAIVYFEGDVAPYLEVEDPDYGYVNFFFASNVYYNEGAIGYTEYPWVSQVYLLQENTEEIKLDVYSVYTDAESPELDEVVEIYGYAEPWVEGFDLYKADAVEGVEPENLEYTLINTVERPVSEATGLTDIMNYIVFGTDTNNFYETVYYYVQGWKVVDGEKVYGRICVYVEFTAEPASALDLNEEMNSFRAYSYLDYSKAMEIFMMYQNVPANQRTYIDSDALAIFAEQLSIAQIYNLSYQLASLKVESLDDKAAVESARASVLEFEENHPELVEYFFNLEYLELAESKITILELQSKLDATMQMFENAMQINKDKIAEMVKEHKLEVELYEATIAQLKEDILTQESNIEEMELKVKEAEEKLAEAKEMMEKAEAIMAEAEQLREEVIGCSSSASDMSLVAGIVLAVFASFALAIIIKKK